jgi:DNA-directed RNA polymerase specialized sigma24 family protein
MEPFSCPIKSNHCLKVRAPLSDEHLVERACGGDYPSFEALVDRYGSLVYSFALFNLQDQRKAEELTLSTFISAVENLGGLDRSDGFAKWLLAIAVRQTRSIRESGCGRIRL